MSSFTEFDRSFEEARRRASSNADGKKLNGKTPNEVASQDQFNAFEAKGVTLADFQAFMPMHNYIYTPSREMWPASSVNARLLPISLPSGKIISPSLWLDRHRPVEQMTWAPGLPMLIRNRLISEGGWIERNGVTCFNLYRPPIIAPGDPNEAGPWLSHVHKVYPDDAQHIIKWLAHRVQRPGDKINHALVLGGKQGIGKDTLLEPVKQAIGPWNFSEVSPQQVLGRFNGFLKSVILRVSEARDLGDVDRFQFYDHMKAYTAAPPDVLRVDVRFSFTGFAEDLDAVIAASGVDRFVLFAMGGPGGAIAMRYAVRHPNRVTHLVLYGCNMRGALGDAPTTEQEAEAQARLKVYDLGWPNENQDYGQFCALLHIPDATAEQSRSFNNLLRETTSPANAVALLNAYLRNNVQDVVPEVCCPTLVLHSRGDSIIPLDQGRSVAALVPGARFVPVESRNRILLDSEPAWQRLVEAFGDFLPPQSAGNIALPLLDDLTAREREILEVVAEGLDNYEIAARLEISEKTVRNHVSTIFSKLQTKSRAHAVALARDAGLGRGIR